MHSSHHLPPLSQASQRGGSPRTALVVSSQRAGGGLGVREGLEVQEAAVAALLS